MSKTITEDFSSFLVPAGVTRPYVLKRIPSDGCSIVVVMKVDGSDPLYDFTFTQGTAGTEMLAVPGTESGTYKFNGSIAYDGDRTINITSSDQSISLFRGQTITYSVDGPGIYGFREDKTKYDLEPLINDQTKDHDIYTPINLTVTAEGNAMSVSDFQAPCDGYLWIKQESWEDQACNLIFHISGPNYESGSEVYSQISLGCLCRPYGEYTEDLIFMKKGMVFSGGGIMIPITYAETKFTFKFYPLEEI